MVFRHWVWVWDGVSIDGFHTCESLAEARGADIANPRTNMQRYEKKTVLRAGRLAIFLSRSAASGEYNAHTMSAEACVFYQLILSRPRRARENKQWTRVQVPTIVYRYRLSVLSTRVA